MILHYKKLQASLLLPNAENIFNEKFAVSFGDTNVNKLDELTDFMTNFPTMLIDDSAALLEEHREAHDSLMNKGMIPLIVVPVCMAVLTYATLPVIIMNVLLAIYVFAMIWLLITAIKMYMTPAYEAPNYDLLILSAKDVIEEAAKQSPGSAFTENDIATLEYASTNRAWPINNVYTVTHMQFFGSVREAGLLSPELNAQYKLSL